MTLRKVRWIGLVCAAGAPLSGFAQQALPADAPARAVDSDKLEEIVVTAERRVSDVQKTANSVSVRSGNEMKALGRYSLKQILEDVPGLVGGAAETTGGSLGSGTDQASAGLTIRGIQSNSGAGGSVTSVAPAAAIYVDGVYEGLGGSYDIDRVELLRGPQGTLYGRSATAGLVAIHTAQPDSSAVGGNVGLEFGNYNLQHYTAALNVPLVSDVLAVRVAGNRFERDGYDSAEGGARRTTDGKVKVLYTPTENLSFLFGAALQDNETHSGGTTITLATPNSYAYTPTDVGTGNNEFRQYWGQFDWDLGAATLTYLPAYRTWESNAFVSAVRGAITINQTIKTPRDRFTTHELRLASNAGAKLNWQVGALYYENSLANLSTATLLPANALAFSSTTRDKTTRATGVFAEATYSFAETWRFTGGVRHDDTKVAVTQDYTSITLVTQTLSGDAGKRKFNNFTYKARLEHDLTDWNLVYASLSTGFSPGDVSVTTGLTGTPVLLELDAETLRAYELGSKNRFLNDRLQINGALFYYDYSGYQTANVDIGGNPENPVFATLSSPAQVYGGELETLYQITPADRLALNLAYTNAYYVGKSGVQVPTGTGSFVQLSDFFARDKIADVAPFTGSLSYQHTVSLPGGSSLTLRGAARYFSAHDADQLTQVQLANGALPYARIGAEWVGDFNLSWLSSNEKYSATGYVRNVGDNRYKTAVGVSGSTAPFDTSLATPYDPRTYGVTLNARF